MSDIFKNTEQNLDEKWRLCQIFKIIKTTFTSELNIISKYDKRFLYYKQLRTVMNYTEKNFAYKVKCTFVRKII